MRLLLLMLGISVCVVGIGTRAEAQNYPWCANYSEGAAGGGTNCGFVFARGTLAAVFEPFRTQRVLVIGERRACRAR